MSRIDDLLADLAPEGVEQRRLGDIARLVRGNGMPKAVLSESGVGAIHYGQIYTRYGAWTSETYSLVPEEIATKLAKVDPGDLIVTNTSENLDDVGKAVAWLGRDTIVTGGHATVIKHSLDSKYLAYWFQSPSFSAQKRALATGTKVIDVSARQLERVLIPVPPVEVQREIVRVLDQFTRLEAELEAELEARREQYRYYRQTLLDQLQADRVELGHLGKWVGGMTPSKANRAYWDHGHIPWLASMDISDGSEMIRGRVTDLALSENAIKIIPPPSVAVITRSNILRRRLPVRLVTEATTVNQDVRALRPDQGIDAAYVYECLAADEERLRAACVRTDGSMAAVDSAKFFAWTIPLPSYETQLSLSRTLAQFRGLTSDLSIGLPAEIAARRKQYEYYRDKLLTFDEAPA